MRKLTGLLCLLGALSAPAMAADVAVIDWRQALLDSQAAKQAMEELRNETGDQRQRAEALRQELQALQQRLQKDSAVMSEDERKTARQEFQQKAAEFQQLRVQIQQAQKEKEQAFLKSAKPQLDRAIDQVVEKHDVQVLLDRDAVVYNAEGLDLTQEVTRIINAN
ncbi:MAG: OmpH family outer membrane protein [Halomonas sp.]|nr:OmpH family outer membrane protein [Halomonas sp.]